MRIETNTVSMGFGNSAIASGERIIDLLESRKVFFFQEDKDNELRSLVLLFVMHR
jgi:hypothetical protein